MDRDYSICDVTCDGDTIAWGVHNSNSKVVALAETKSMAKRIAAGLNKDNERRKLRKMLRDKG